MDKFDKKINQLKELMEMASNLKSSIDNNKKPDKDKLEDLAKFKHMFGQHIAGKVKPLGPIFTDKIQPILKESGVAPVDCGLALGAIGSGLFMLNANASLDEYFRAVEMLKPFMDTTPGSDETRDELKDVLKSILDKMTDKYKEDRKNEDKKE